VVTKDTESPASCQSEIGKKQNATSLCQTGQKGIADYGMKDSIHKEYAINSCQLGKKRLLISG
jgi:hypothetical protein